MENYRGVAILSSIPKLFELLVKNKLDFMYNKKISSFQHGFIKGRSTVSNLAVLCNQIFKSVENGNQSDVIYTDFSKAFDQVDHSILLKKLHRMDNAMPLKWLWSYLTGRTQYVKIDDFESEIFNVRSGVPQGSHLGPFLFVLFIDDAISCFSFASVLLYADDLKIYSTIKTLNDALALQKDLNVFCSWTVKNRLLLNVSKCKVLTFHRKKEIINFQCYL